TLGGVTISGTVYVDTDGNGMPNRGETASTLTVVHTETATTVATITISGFTFDGDFAALLASGVNTTTGRILLNTADHVPLGDDKVDGQVTGMDSVASLRGWTFSDVTLTSPVYHFNDNSGGQSMAVSGTLDISDGLGTTYNNVAISGTVTVDVGGVEFITSVTGGSVTGSVGGQAFTVNVNDAIINQLDSGALD
ncbi:hypothetical protein EBQ93_03475, partial [bacterium]|nr:hypothetical protein [bacterium]